MKKAFVFLLSFLLLLQLLLPVVPAASAAWNTSYTLTGNQAQDIVSVAVAQKDKTGSDLGYSSSWCSYFVYDCAQKANIPSSMIPRQGYASSLYRVMTQNGTEGHYFTDVTSQLSNWTGGSGGGMSSNYDTQYSTGIVSSNWTPRIGDIVFFTYTAYSTISHVAIVQKAFQSDGSNLITVVHGNWSSKVTVGTTMPRGGLKTMGSSTYAIVAYARPSYSSSSVSTLSINPTAYPTGTILAGQPFTLEGTVTSNYLITEFSGMVFNSSGGVSLDEVTMYPNSYSVNIKNSAVDLGLSFASLPPDTYYLGYFATDASGKTVEWSSNWFRVEEPGVNELIIAPTTCPSGTLTYGNSFSLQGTVSSNYPVNFFKGVIYNSAHEAAQTATCTPNSYTVDIRSSNVNQNLIFNQLVAGSYYLYYYATDTYGMSKEWCSDWFTISGGTTKPDKPTVSVPQSTYIIGDSIPISWNAVAGNADYRMDIYKDGTAIVQTSMGQTTSYTYTSASVGSYTVYVSANNSVGTSGSSSCSFTVRNPYTVPDTPVISASRSWVRNGQSITISWNAVEDATSYQYVVSEYPYAYAYQNYLIRDNTQNASVTFYASNMPNGRYCVFVHASNPAGDSAQSNWLYFDVYDTDYYPTLVEEHDGHLYAVYDCELSWTFAEQVCEGMGGHLAAITSQEENDYIGSLIADGTKDAYWIGARNDITGSWNDSDNPYVWVTGEEFSYSNWHTGEPNSDGTGGNKEHFAEMRKSINNQWNDMPNYRRSGIGFIFELDASSWDPVSAMTHGSSKYLLFDSGSSWSEAKAYCEANGGHLATISSAEEDAAITNLLQNGSHAWYRIGGRSVDGTWKWLDNTDIPLSGSYANWSGTSGTVQDGPTGWGEYLIKYRFSGTWIGLQNCYMPISDIVLFGFVLEIDDAVNTLTLDPNGGTLTNPEKTIVFGDAYGELSTPTYSNYIFEGWFTEPDGGELISADTIVNVKSDQTLYAHWSHVCADGHEFGPWTQANEPTCTEQGYMTRTCVRCSMTESIEIAPLGHDYAEAVTEPSCTEGGYTTHTCSRCGDSYVDNETDALGHSLGAWTQTSVPSCTEPGYIKRICSRCDYSESIEVAALGHLAGEAAQENYVEPTPTEEGGYDTVVRCTRCSAVLSSEHTVLPPTGPTEPIETEALHVYSSISVGTDMVISLTARKNDLTNYNKFWIEVVKHEAEGDRTFRYGEDQPDGALTEGSTTWGTRFTNIFAKEMGVDIEARLYAEDASGQVYMSPVRAINIRDYLGGRLTATTNKVEQRVLAADMLNYGAAAQMFTDYQTDHLVNEELTAEQLVKLHEYETKELPAVNKTNYNYRPEGASNILFNSVTLGNEVVLNLTVRLTQGTENVQVLVKDHATGAVVTTLDTTWSGSSIQACFSGIGADKMRTEFDFVTLVNGVETGNTRTWSVEAYVGEIRNGNLPLKTNLANALLTYGDSAAAYFAAQ